MFEISDILKIKKIYTNLSNIFSFFKHFSFGKKVHFTFLDTVFLDTLQKPAIKTNVKNGNLIELNGKNKF